MSEGGTEDSTLRVLVVEDASFLDEAIPNTRACSVAWEPDGSGFLYTRYPDGDEYHRTVHAHRLGDDAAGDPVVWANHVTPETWPSVDVSPDGRWVLVHATVGWSRHDVHLFDRLTPDAGWRDVIAGIEVVTNLAFDAAGTGAGRHDDARGAEGTGRLRAAPGRARRRWPIRRGGRRSSPNATSCSAPSPSPATSCSWSPPPTPSMRSSAGRPRVGHARNGRRRCARPSRR